MSFQIALQEVLTHLRQERRSVTKSLSRLPAGELLISKAGKYMRYFLVEIVNGKRKMTSIGKKPRLVMRLAKKRFLEELLKRLDHNIGVCEKALRESVSTEPQNMINSLPRNFDLLDEQELLYGKKLRDWPNPSRDPQITPHLPLLDIGCLDPAEWAEEPYCENTSYLDLKIHRNARGILCRSKSEVSILDMYDYKGLFYHTDETLIIDGELLSPDVIAVRHDGTLIYHEHCGMQSVRYSERLQHKLWLYEKAGIVPGKNLILTFDRADGSLNMAIVEQLIDDYFFR